MSTALRCAAFAARDIAATRAVLLAIIENLAGDELVANMRMPSTRALSGVEKRRRPLARRARKS